MPRLSKPVAYGKILPLCGSNAQPVRCTPFELWNPNPENGHNWYYDLTDDHELSGDPESTLVWLCDRCARKLEEEVQFAGTDAYHDGPCWHCHG